MKNQKGFSLPEMLVSSAILLFIVISIYFLISTTQTTHLSEGRKLDMNQASRAFEQMLCDGIRSAGSVLSLLHAPTFLGSPPAFNGIYPLNNNAFPDGIILASGDPKGVTATTADFDVTSGPVTIAVESVANPDDTTLSAWEKDDVGMVARAEGFYIFKVAVTPTAIDTALTIRSTPVYYSGLLNTTHYDDLMDDHNVDASKKGNAYTYSIGTPVIRLDFFNLFLVHEAGGVRTLTLTTDAEGVADILNSPATAMRAVPIFNNIEDLQFEYVTKGSAPELWASSAVIGTTYSNPCSASSSTNCTNFITQFISRNIGSVRIFVLFKTEEEVNKPQGSGVVFSKPIMGDVSAAILPVGRFHYNYMKYEVAIRNYLIVY